MRSEEMDKAGIHWRGHAFLFNRSRVATYGESTGRRLLLIFVILEGVIGPRLSLFNLLHVRVPAAWVRIPVLLLLALVLVRYFARLEFSQIGLARWRDWTAIEKSYFVQVVVIANAVFILILTDRLRSTIAEPGLPGRLLTVFLPYLLWGLYQELVYRGILQTELVRRWGAVRGILVSNVLFTFGPLHFYHLSRSAASIPTFAGIFVTGLFFAILFERSRNLWMVGVFHGIGNAYIDGTAHH
jgi:membrane protease YdiL (CAAX protease family)